MTVHPKLWALLKRWIHILDHTEFYAMWEQIKAKSPASFLQYMEMNWMHETELWSAIFRTERSIFQNSDTNMLVEAWHHLLKGKFMQGKRNCRMDHLIYTLVRQAMPHFIQRHFTQEHGFAGGDLEVQECLHIEELAEKITADDIEQSDDEENIFHIQSQTQKDLCYTVDLNAYDCDCLSFPKILMCKHLSHLVEPTS
ncbi:hypothetical protein D9611_008883 [Ephemerocybe angulata]|uniref:SWIM-type domain-containing protein n=1 Tax=Ephemerocybe angulata TaxID=980116 RepID=A0A8H5C0P7_9AGAR|nr:hypothetical protein D9611_008883 [Tulosesus angulatus]